MAPPSYAVRASVRVRGVTYRDPTEAFVAADELEHDAQQRADAYRRNGDDGLADTAIDRGRADAEKLRTWARQREEFEAHATTQPPARPEPSAPRPAARAARRSPSRPRRSGSRFGGRSGSYARTGYRRSGAQAAVVRATGFGWYIAGATIGVALLTLFLSSRGSKAFAELAAAAATALRVVVDPVDPLAPHLLDQYVAQAQASTMPAAPLPRSSVPANRRAPRGALA